MLLVFPGVGEPEKFLYKTLDYFKEYVTVDTYFTLDLNICMNEKKLFRGDPTSFNSSHSQLRLGRHRGSLT